jgi:hypothetical protein
MLLVRIDPLEGWREESRRPVGPHPFPEPLIHAPLTPAQLLDEEGRHVPDERIGWPVSVPYLAFCAARIRSGRVLLSSCSRRCQSVNGIRTLSAHGKQHPKRAHQPPTPKPD